MSTVLKKEESKDEFKSVSGLASSLIKGHGQGGAPPKIVKLQDDARFPKPSAEPVRQSRVRQPPASCARRLSRARRHARTHAGANRHARRQAGAGWPAGRHAPRHAQADAPCAPS